MNPQDAIINKIKKLLRMKRGGLPDEVATALRLAQELAEKHGIDLNAVNPDDETTEKPVTHMDEILGMRTSWESKYASLVVNRFFKVRVFRSINAERSKYVMCFVGEEWDIQIAIYVYRFLCGHFRREWNTGRGRCRNRQAFLFGMYFGLVQKLAERQPVAVQTPGLMRTERALARRNDYIQKHWGELDSTSVKPDDNATEARMRGYLAGRLTEIRSGVGVAESQPAIPTVGEGRMLA